MKRSILDLRRVIVGIVMLSCISVPAMLCTDYAPGSAVPRLAEADSRDLQYLFEEIKLCRDACLSFYTRYDEVAFSEIPKSELRNMEAIQELCTTFGETVLSGQVGTFNNPKLQQLYDGQIKRGSTSRQAALLAGAYLEERCLIDLKDASIRARKDEIRVVFDRLYCGSQRHLNAFVSAYESHSGKAYKAQVLPQFELDRLLGR